MLDHLHRTRRRERRRHRRPDADRYAVRRGRPDRAEGTRRPRRRGDLGLGAGQGRRRGPTDGLVPALHGDGGDLGRDRGGPRLVDPGGRRDGGRAGVQRGRAVAVGLAFARWGLVGHGLRLLLGGFAFAIAVVTLLALVTRVTGLVTLDMVTASRPQTGFIWHPDMWSFIVALIAGAAGALALAIDKMSTMVGVFISVTTIPAAGNLALGFAFWDPSRSSAPSSSSVRTSPAWSSPARSSLFVVRTSWDWITSTSPSALPRLPPGRRQVAVGVVGREAHPVVERQRRRVVARAPAGTPWSRPARRPTPAARP